MLWREPRSWRFSAHMPDDLFGAMLSGLFRCELSAQQLAMLHSHSPDLTPTVEEAEMAANSDDGDGDIIEKRYSVKGLNSSEPRFCGPGMATAALINRFHKGLPATLQHLPATKIVVLVRNPVDVVVTRIQAKWVRGGPAWPACTLRTIEQCASELCGSMMQMLRTLPTGGDRLRLLRWETFARRKQRVASDLLSWLGAVSNQSAVADLMIEVDGELKAFKAVSDKYPLSPPSTFVVEQRCADVMQWLGYKPTVEMSLSGGVLARATPLRFIERTRRSASGHRRRGGQHLANGSVPLDEDGSLRPPAILLRHTAEPKFEWCPIRLAGAEPFMRFFVRRDAPAASAAPLCFPESASDRCPSRHGGAKWHRSRWGSYPFEVIERPTGVDSTVSLGPLDRPSTQRSPEGFFSFAFVRNPFDRLVSAYIRHIVTQDKGTAVHRSWIRELHSLGDRDPITFSHFVRWVAQQDPITMHRSWQPYSDTCQFARMHYDFIGRLEYLSRDAAHVMDALKLDNAEKRLFEHVAAKSAPIQPLGSEDRILRLRHYYHSDDAHDLIRIVQQRYSEDLWRFNYSFPSS